MATPLIGDRPMTTTERTRRKRRLDKAKIERLYDLGEENHRLQGRVSELEAENDALLAQNERLLAYVREMAGLESPK